MKKIYFLGNDFSIYDSLKNLAEIKKNFIINKIDILKNKKNSLYILDDSHNNFLSLLKFFEKKEKKYIIVTIRKENNNIKILESFNIFLKPLKILDLYKDILNIIKNNQAIKNKIYRLNNGLIGAAGKNLKFTEKESELITVLLSNTGKPVSKKSLLYRVWNLKLEKVDSLNTRVLETLISRIRKKIKYFDIEIKITKSKNGYTLNN